jgi:Rieske 2Fe-2S family protein
VTLVGLFGRPYLDLEPLVASEELPALDDEISGALPLATRTSTGGTLKWMGVVAPFQMDDPYVDAMFAIERMERAELERFVALGDDPGSVDLDAPRRAFGDETDHPFTPAQVTFLEVRHGVYFPWKACVHLLENDRWDDKHTGYVVSRRGGSKDFTDEAKRLFPRTVAFVQALPFRELGRVVIFGLNANDHAPFHRDTEPGKALQIAQSISIDPRGTKRFVLAGPDGAEKVPVEARVYWFNDMDYHGVEADPSFRYSIRCDGVFEAGFMRTLRARFG